MHDLTGKAHEVELEKVFRDFQKWRSSTPKAKRRIPSVFWEKAVALTQHFTVSRIHNKLSLSYSELKSRVIASRQFSDSIKDSTDSKGRVEKSETIIDGSGSGDKNKFLRSPISNNLGDDKSDSVDKGLSVIAQEGKRSSKSLCFQGNESIDTTDQSLENDGFIELIPTFGNSQRPPPLAEIVSPDGMLLRLFSQDTGRIVRAFLSP